LHTHSVKQNAHQLLISVLGGWDGVKALSTIESYEEKTGSWVTSKTTRYNPKYCRRSVSALSAGAYTTTLLVMVDRVKGEGRAPPTVTRLG
jgi:hypothetical protein